MRTQLVAAALAMAFALASAHASGPPTGGDKSMATPPIKERVAVMEEINNANVGALVVKKLSAITLAEDIVNTKNRLSRSTDVSLLVGQGESDIISGYGGMLQLENEKIDTIGLARGSPRGDVGWACMNVSGYIDCKIGDDRSVIIGIDSGGGGGAVLLDSVSGGQNTERIGLGLVQDVDVSA